MNPLYPPKPLNADAVSITPSVQFKKEVVGVVYTIVLFFAVYLLLVIGAVLLSIACFYLGYSLIVAMPKFLTLVIGLGLMAVGLSLVYFLLKFIFAKRTTDNSQRVELKESEQPRLFAFIRTLTKETQTPFPKKIYLSAQVNACVFYNSSFWSMFIPVRKNLEIGLGLVNAINMGEFKAVMAHEFGHFSQRSMKLGSFTYNVNQVIYNMLYENNSYTNFLNAWGSLDGILAIFASITVGIARGIQWILKQVYMVMNKRYMSLSREMEFHADAVAASVSGGNNLVTAFHRIELASASYNHVLAKVNEAIERKQASQNVFADQLVVMQQTSLRHGLSLQQGLPVVTPAFLTSRFPSRINYKDQWASHPTNQDRTERLQQLGLDAAVTDTPAWAIFDQPEALQLRLTNHIYNTAQVAVDGFQLYAADEFKQRYEDNEAAWSLPPVYKDFFEGYYPYLAQLPAANATTAIAWSTIDTTANRHLKDQLARTTADLQIVEAIAKGDTGIKYFDFDGTKRSAGDAAEVATLLRTETASLQQRRQELDQELLTWLMQENREGLPLYRKWLLLDQQLANPATAIMNTVQLFSDPNLTIGRLQGQIDEITEIREPALRTLWQHLLDEQVLQAADPLHTEITAFMATRYVYLTGSDFNNEAFNHLLRTVSNTEHWIAKQKIAAFRAWLQPTVPTQPTLPA
ncbi:M48 family metallopeptidase [Paraflavitalea pollutisoli]|uniref:M48 family metallopeptidase n=1 Tax=Paraflavitalea pollutisoli TaxID=3034143 RepID=UPI0023EDBAE2|nr:M48 family metallopeptidase [Paraflavitalea sp. H1-2-19X]